MRRIPALIFILSAGLSGFAGPARAAESSNEPLKEPATPIAVSSPTPPGSSPEVAASTETASPAPAPVVAPPTPPGVSPGITLHWPEEFALFQAPDDDFLLSDVEIEGGYDTAAIFSNLTTSFQTPVAKGLSWSETVTPRGLGFHGAAYYHLPSSRVAGTNRDLAVGATFGYFSSVGQGYRTAAQGFYSHETVDLRCKWVALDAKGGTDWIYLKASLAVFVYDVQTQIYTNTQNYSYNDLAGRRGFGAFGLGLGLTTPKKYHVRAFVEGTFWIPSDESSIESGVAMASAGLTARF
jgi:hypothetical protein